MLLKIRHSKFKNVFGNPSKDDFCYKNIKITKNAHDSAFCAVNTKFLAVVTEECGGGAFIVIPLTHIGRIDANIPKICGHKSQVNDIKWNPFNENEIASCAEDATIKLWSIDDNGLTENLKQSIVDLHCHRRKVGHIEWHPTAENIMISSGDDYKVILWNLKTANFIRIISCHSDTIQCMSWNRDGSLFATTCKDRKIRVIDPRSGTVLAEGFGHQSVRISKVVMLRCGRILTTGFSKTSERQIALWDSNDLSKPIHVEVVDSSSGTLIPYYDQDTNMLFVAGKGDGNIRYYEITDTAPYIHYLDEYMSTSSQRGLGFMPKRGLDVTKNEIFRFYKLHTIGGICEPISMIVPRRSEYFQDDIYPDTASGIPSLSSEEWISGETREPILKSMRDQAVPRIVTFRQLGHSKLAHKDRQSDQIVSNPEGMTVSLGTSTKTDSLRVEPRIFIFGDKTPDKKSESVWLPTSSSKKRKLCCERNEYNANDCSSGGSAAENDIQKEMNENGFDRESILNIGGVSVKKRVCSPNLASSDMKSPSSTSCSSIQYDQLYKAYFRLLEEKNRAVAEIASLKKELEDTSKQRDDAVQMLGRVQTHKRKLYSITSR